MSRIMIAGTGSGSGKTTIVCGLCRCLQERGLKLSALKCGPDYIDSMFHSRILKMQTGNLDSWFCDEKAIKKLLLKKETGSDITIIEGAMGYFDGTGFSRKGSSYEIASITDTPVILVVNCRGMSNSVISLLKGFVESEEKKQICGVIFNGLSEKLYKMAAEESEKMGICPLGYVPYKKNAKLKSRHLGLVTAEEVVHLEEKIDNIAKEMKKSLDLDKIVEMAKRAVSIKESDDCSCHTGQRYIKERYIKESVKTEEDKKLRIAAAKDAAFCFLYEDNLEYLREHGCEIVFFSPIYDKYLPNEIDGLLLYGGYPELYAEELSQNKSMREDISERIRNGIPCIAECGGFLYLHERLETPEKVSYPMVGVIAGNGYAAGKLQRFGYVTMTSQKDTMLAAKGEHIYAHEFHYWNSDYTCSDYEIEKASDKSVEFGVYGTPNLYAGFPHIYFYGNETAAGRFLNKCIKYHESRNYVKYLFPEMSNIEGLDKNAVKQAQNNWNKIAKPLYSLGKMETLITQIAGIEKNADVSIKKRAVIVMCADNGIVQEGVTQTGQEVTAVVSCKMADGISSVCKMAACAKTDVIPVNIGIAAEKLPDGTDVDSYKGLVNQKIMSGTKNFLKEPAMSDEQVIQAVQTGIREVELCKKEGYEILATGEMGIGNTTTSTALACILLELNPSEVTGRGAGLDNKGLARKVEVIEKSVELYAKYKENPLKLLQNIGGLDIAGLTGVFLGGAMYRIPVVVDGVISAVAALIAIRLFPVVRDFIIVSHQSKEPVMKELLSAIDKEAVIFADLALGEGTGAVMLFPLLDMALEVYRENTTFEDLRIQAYEDYKKC